MSSRVYLVVSGSVFAIVAVLHLLRALNGWAVDVGPWSLPVGVSWLGAAFPAVLSAWAFRVASRQRS